MTVEITFLFLFFGKQFNISLIHVLNIGLDARENRSTYAGLTAHVLGRRTKNKKYP